MAEFDHVDTTDLKILRELDKDPRASYKQIGRRTRLNAQTVRYRINRLEEDNIITGYWGFVDLAGYSVHKILLKNRTLGEDGRAELKEWLLDQSCISWFADLHGAWDYVITVNAETERAFAGLVQELLRRFGDDFQERSFLISTNAFQTNEKYLHAENELHDVFEHDYMDERLETDERDEALLRHLALDGRAGYTELAEHLDITPEAVSKRVRKLRERGLLKGTKIRINVNKLGLSYYHLFVALDEQDAFDRMRRYCIQHRAATVIMRHLGRYDLHCEFILEDDAMRSVMDDIRERFGTEIGTYELLRVRKEYTMHLLR